MLPRLTNKVRSRENQIAGASAPPRPQFNPKMEIPATVNPRMTVIPIT
jgi:hypothetical protein